MLLQLQVPGCEDARANRNLLFVVAIFFITMPCAGTLYLNNYMLLEGFYSIFLFARQGCCTVQRAHWSKIQITKQLMAQN